MDDDLTHYMKACARLRDENTNLRAREAALRSAMQRIERSASMILAEMTAKDYWGDSTSFIMLVADRDEIRLLLSAAAEEQPQ